MASVTDFLSEISDSLLFWVSHPVQFILPVTVPSPSLCDTLMWVLLVSSVFCWVMSLLTDNLSQVDRLWSLLPPLYSAIITYYCIKEKGVSSSSGMVLMTLITSLWGGRLTYQFIKKDGYTLYGEDYRWKYVKEVFRGRYLALQIFNLFFVVIYQNILLFLLVVPQAVLLTRDTTCSVSDALIGLLYMGLVVLETMSDAQQQVFQKEKYKQKGEGVELKGDYKAGFLRSGLFKYCRHPNYVCEVLLWWVFALFSLSRLGFNWTFIGAANLTGLFTGSVDITEQISSKKYPEYVEYQRRVPAYIPSVRMINIK